MQGRGAVDLGDLRDLHAIRRHILTDVGQRAPDDRHLLVRMGRAKAVVRGATRAHVVGDMPFGSYQAGLDQGVANAARLMNNADWLPNLPKPASADFYRSFRTRFPNPADDYVHMRMQLMIEALAQAIEKAGSAEAVPLARALEHAKVSLAGQSGQMRAADHQFQQSLVVGVMDRQGTPGVPFDVEGSGYGFRVVRQIAPAQAEMPHSCKMARPE